MLTGAQIRAARGLLDISKAQLAELAGLGVNTIRRAESSEGTASITPANMRALRTALETAGVHFIEAGELGAGVQFKYPAPHKPPRQLM